MRRFAALLLASGLMACPAVWAAGDSGSGAKAAAAGDPSSNATTNSSGATSGAVTKTPAAPPAPASTPANTATTSTTPVVSPAPSSAELQYEIEQMRALMQDQAAQIDEQRQEIATMKSEMSHGAASALPAPAATSQPAETMSAASSPAASPAVTLPVEIPVAATAATTSTSRPAATLAADTGSPQHSPLSFKIGDATFAPLGFLDLTDVFRTTGTGAGIGSGFGSIPYNNNLPTAGLTEDRFSAQNSRIGVRVDVPVAGGTMTGYVEADFLGLTAANANVTSNSNSLRMRNYFADYRRGKIEFLAGQDWSMLTPNRKGISPYPSDIFYSQDMDTNYQVGLTWTRQPQIRIVYHPSDNWALGLSIENPDQLVGSAVTTPSAFSGVAGAVDATGGGTLSTPPTPNFLPDFIVKIATDQKVGSKAMHFDFAALVSEFKLVTPASVVGGASRVTEQATGGGFEGNLNLELVKNFHWVGTAYWSDGGGRYIFGLGPDLVVSQATTVSPFMPSPVHAGSGITGFEWQVNPKSMIYGYYGGAYFGKDFSQDPSSVSTKYVGYGYPGGANTQNRTIQEGTIGWIQTFFKNPNLGAFALITQASYVTRDPWAVLSGQPENAHLFMTYVDFRYTLP